MPRSSFIARYIFKAMYAFALSHFEAVQAAGCCRCCCLQQRMYAGFNVAVLARSASHTSQILVSTVSHSQWPLLASS